MPRRVLFVIRGKLGDTLVAYATVRRYADAFPADEVTLLTRAGYAELFAREAGVRVIGFSSRIGMLMQLVKLRIEPRFDALLVLWGFGTPIEWIGRLVRSRRKVYLDARYPHVFPEHADLAPHRLQSEPMWRVASIFEPTLPQPSRLAVPSLAARRSSSPAVIGVAPLADEPRRILSPQMLADLLGAIAQRHPGAPVRVFVNPSDRGAGELLAAGLPSGAEFCFFPQLEDLLRGFAELACLYCTDTGLYHLAASMGIPATVFFGPTQPWRIIMPGQPAVSGIRLAVLGGEHCEEKSCATPLCIEAAVRSFGGGPPLAALTGAPAGCPLRDYPIERLAEVAVHEDTRHQA
jgi:ADP-heptose:LPS heptosyltransferase